MKLYHGTISLSAQNILENGICLSESNPYLDFGPGFYTTQQERFAINTAFVRLKRFENFDIRRKTIKKPVYAAVIEFDYDESILSTLTIKTFLTADAEWGKFIILNRIEKNDDLRNQYDHNFDCKYDIVKGPTADGKSFVLGSLVSSVESGKLIVDNMHFNGILPRNANDWGEQVSFHTHKALACIKINKVVYYNHEGGIANE